MECLFNLNIFSLIISIVALLWSLTYILIKPRLKIDVTCLIENQLSIKIINEGFGTAINLKIESCIIDCSAKTYHLDIDRTDFIMLLPKRKGNNSRTFKTRGFSESALDFIKNKDTTIEDMIKTHNKIRVRVHSEHGFTGFGKAVEQKFKYCNSNNEFIKIK